jgi:hypothetical protein
MHHPHPGCAERRKQWPVARGPGLSKRTRPKSPASEFCRVREAEAQRDRAREREAARDAIRDAQRKARCRNITDPDSRLMPVRGER